jgi:outer membrane protein TolC
MQKIFWILIILFSSTVAAQESAIEVAQKKLNSESLTLEEAVSYALKHSPSLNIEKMKLEEATLQIKESRLQQIPEIYISGNLRRNLIIPATPVPAHIFDSSKPDKEMMYLQFNTNWNSSAGVNLNYDLFNPEKWNSVAQQKQQLKIQEYDVQISEEKLREDIALAYAECVIAEEQKLMMIKDTIYYASMFNVANQLYLKEKITLTEKNNIHRSYNESINSYLEAENIVKERKAKLLYLLGKDVTPNNIALLTLQEGIQDLLKKMEQSVFKTTILNNLEEIRQKEVVSLTDLRLKSTLMKYAPTLSINGYYGSNYYYNDFSLFNNKYWRGNSFIGLSISLPVTQSFRTSNEVSRLRLQRQMDVEYLRDIQNSKEKEKINKFSLLEVRKKSYHLSRENWELSQQNSETSIVEFEKGYILQTDLLNEQLKMQQTRQSFLQSAYDLFCILISLKETKNM